MNWIKKNRIVVIAVLLLGIVAFLVFKTQSKQATIEQIYTIEDTASVTKIFMADKNNNKVLLERKPNSSWIVNKTYPAAQHSINMLLGTLNAMQIRQPVALAAHNNIIKALSSSSTKVEIYQQGYVINWFGGKLKLFSREKLAKVIYVGQETQDNQGTYMLLKDEKEPVIVYVPGFRGYLTPRFSANPLTWRSHEIFNLNVRQIQSVKIEIPAKPEESFEIVRRDNTFDMKMLSTGTVLPAFDTARVGDFLASFVKMNFDKFAVGVTKVEKDSILAKPPVFVVTISDMAGNSKWLKTYVKFVFEKNYETLQKEALYEILDVDRMYGLMQGIPDTVILQYYIFDNVLKPANYFYAQPSGSTPNRK